MQATDVMVVRAVVEAVVGTPRTIHAAPAPPEVGAPAAVADVPVPVVPRVVGEAPRRVVEGIVEACTPAVVPRRVDEHRGVGCAPRSEHRGDVLGLNPHLRARHHHVVERGVVGRDVETAVAVAQIEVARRHIVGERLEAAQTTCVGTLVRVSQKTVIDVTR